MKCLRRNMTDFEYLPYTGTETDLNSDGEHTGEFYPEYDNPIPYRGNISTPSGQTNQTFYGEDIRYTHTLVMDDPNCGIKENGLIRWNDNMYDILAVRPSLNAISIALRRRTNDNIPIVPIVPDEPVEPDTPVVPGTPDAPETPEEPDVPVVSEPVAGDGE